MSSNRKPRKPARNPTHIAYSDSGQVRKEIEELPREKENLEFTIVKKFLGALKYFKGIQYTELQQGSEPADLICKSTDGQTINIQVTEVFDPKLTKLQQMRSTYTIKLKELLGDEELLYGCRVILEYSGPPPYLPPIKSMDGKARLSSLEDFIRIVAQEVSSLGVREWIFRDTKNLLPECEVGIFVERMHPIGELVRPEVIWTGANPPYRVDISRGLLTRSVQKKVDKLYSKPSEGLFLLLAYSIYSLLDENDPDVLETSQLLATEQHPFDDVWFIFPYVDKELGFIFRIWQREKVDS
jgi:hypothetical protein